MSTATTSQTSTPQNVHELVAKRWSPNTFLDKPVPEAELRGLFEAARWAASCYNEQPWRFVTATRDSQPAFEKILSTFVEYNRNWARSAWLLGFSAGKKTFARNGQPNRYQLYDTGFAAANLAIEATARGLQVHFMGGFDVDLARKEFEVPDDFEIGAAFAVGYGDPSAEPGQRNRKPLAELAFGPEWGKAACFIEG